MPEVVDGIEQTPLPGVSMRYSFDAADAQTRKEMQYYEMLGTRGIWHKGWKAVTEHGPVPLNLGKFDQDRWQLFHTDEDRAEAHDLADRHPERLEELKALWLEEAKKYDVLPLNDLGIFEFRALEYEIAVPESGQYTYYPGTSEVPEASAARTTNASHRILAEVEFTPETEGVIVAQGSRFGGFSLFVKDGKLTYAYNFLGIPPEQRITGDAPSSGTHIVGIEFTKERTGEHHEPHGPVKLFVDDDVLAEAEIRTVASSLQPLRRGAVHRLRRRRRGQQRVPPEVRVHRRHDRQGRLRRRRRRVHRRRAPHGGRDGSRLGSGLAVAAGVPAERREADRER